MSSINDVNLGVMHQGFIAPPKQPVTRADIFRQRQQEAAIIAKAKKPEERTLGDYITLADYYMNKIMNVPVIYLDNSHINYMG